MGVKSKIVVFDLETGGLDPLKSPIMEIGLVTADQITFEEEIQYETLVKPYQIEGRDLEVQQGAINVHGIQPSRCVREGRELRDIVAELIALFGKLKPKGSRTPLNYPVLSGHNVAFDVAFLDLAFAISGEELHRHVLSNNGQIIVWDTMQMALQNWNTTGDGKYNLGACCEKAGLGNFLAHSALADTRITLDLLRYFLRGMREGKKAAIVPTKETKKRDKLMPERKVKFQF